MRTRYLKSGLLVVLAVLAIVAVAYAATVSQKLYGVASPRYYSMTYGDSGSVGSYYLEHPTLTGNDQFVAEDATQTLTNKTLSGASNTLSDIGNSSLTAGLAYFTVALHHEGQETVTLDPAATFQMPFAATLVEVSVAARDIDTADADETYTVDLEEAGTTVLSSAVSIAADNTPVVGTVSDSAIADNAKMELVLTLGGTSPAIDDLTVLLTFKVDHTS